jgi:spermidine/putrescine transport system substrate-binding protein
VPPGLLEQFTKETGIKVIYSTYESNETMYAKLKTYKDGAYDLVVPSTYFVDKMRKEGMIQKIDKTKLTNFSNLDPEMLNKPFDPNNDYSIPYIWGATALASTVTPSTRKPSPVGPICGNRNTKVACCSPTTRAKCSRLHCVSWVTLATPRIQKRLKRPITS